MRLKFVRQYGFAADFRKTGASCRADVYRKRQTHIRSAPSSRTAVTGSDPYKAFSRNVRNFGLLQSSRERSKKTEEVFLVSSRESEGKSKSPPNRKFSLQFGKEEMSTEDKKPCLQGFVPSWSFLTRQRFLLEKQKKMLKGSHKPVQSISLLIDFHFPLLQSKFLPSIPSVSLRLTAPLAARGDGGFFFPL